MTEDGLSFPEAEGQRPGSLSQEAFLKKKAAARMLRPSLYSVGR